MSAIKFNSCEVYHKIANADSFATLYETHNNVGKNSIAKGGWGVS